MLSTMGRHEESLVLEDCLRWKHEAGTFYVGHMEDDEGQMQCMYWGLNLEQAGVHMARLK